MDTKIKQRYKDTLNGALNKLLIDGYVVIRESDGHVLSDTEIMALTRPFFLVSAEDFKIKVKNDTK